ncbi:MAG: fatty acid--CoA ligase [Thermodesulfobacteriota bacterium]|nr:fatty acid--CoA ligase [Thermodesulfobacteriota bacterium]
MINVTNLRNHGFRYQLTIKELLSSTRFFAPEQKIVYRDKVRITYRDMLERIDRLAGALDHLGVKKGDTISVFDYDSHRYLECYFAIPMMGAVLQTINWRLSPEQIEYTLNHAEADVVLIHTDFLPLLEAIKDRLTTIKKIVVLSDDDKIPENTLSIDAEYEDMLKAAPAQYNFPELDEDTIATIFYTTGTTGLPKGVYFSHRQLVLHTLGLATSLASFDPLASLTVRDTYMPVTPMFHVHAWGIPYLTTMLGIKQVYPGKYEPEMLLKLIIEEEVTFSHCVPTILQMLVGSPIAKRVDLSSWKVVIGGAKLSKGLAKAALDLGIKVMSGYGMSETCPLISLGTLKPYMHEWDSEKQSDIVIKTGLPVPLTTVKIIDSTGKELPAGGLSAGEIILRSPWLTQGYFKDTDKSKELWDNGWLHTGDVGYIDEEGYIQITDRIKDVIKTGGEWISSLDIENLMSMHDAVQESAAIGMPDNKWGERPIVILTLKPEYKNNGINAEVLKAYMKECASQGSIPKYGVPDQYIIVDDIPKTSVGKIDKKLLRKMHTPEDASITTQA